MPRRRKGSGQHAQTRKTFLILGAVIAVIVIAIVLVQTITFEGPPLMPPEDPDIVAQRLDAVPRFEAMLDIGGRVPETPPPFETRDDETYGFKGHYIAPCGSIGHMFDINRFDDDAELLAYMSEIAKLASDVEAAIGDGSSIIKPPVDDFAQYRLRNTDLYAVVKLAHHLAAAAQAEALDSGDWKRAHEMTLLGIRLATAWGTDGTTRTYGTAANAQQRALAYYYASVIAQAPNDEVEAMIDAIDEASLAHHDLTSNVEFDWRCIDSPHVGAFIWNKDSDELEDEGFDSRIFIMQFISKTKSDIENNREDMLRSAKGTNIEHRAWLKTLDDEFDKFGYSINGLNYSVAERGNLRAMIAGLRVAAAIDAHIDEHGAPPESLKILGIDATDPLNPNGDMFRYRVNGNDFTLYSVGDDGHNHKAYTGGRRARDVIIHKAAAECAEEHQEFLDKF